MISISNITKNMSGVPLYEGATFQVNPGEKVSLVGPNGVGKSTFFRMIMGEEKPDVGQISKGSDTRVSYFSQNVGEMKGRTALEEVMAGHGRMAYLGSELKKIEEQLCDPNIDPDEMNKTLVAMGDFQTEFEKLGGYEAESVAAEILSGLAIDTSEHHKDVGLFSGGWKMRIALAKVLMSNPDVVLMDEPTNYLDMETILWLEGWLQQFKGSLLVTSHDRDFLNSVTDKTVEISHTGIVSSYGGNFDFYMKEKEIRKKQNAAEFSRQQSMLKKEEEFIAKFKARASHAAQVQSRVKKLEKINRVELDSEQEQMSILLPEIPRGGNDVVLIKGLHKSFTKPDGDILNVLTNVDAILRRQEKIAVTGVNGVGKSTLLKMIEGRLDSDSGEIKVGPSINMGYFGQFSMDNLNANSTIFEEVSSKLPGASDGFIRNLLAAFLFKGDEIFKKIKVLSGGEKSRVVLSWLLSKPYNLLLLDEPTNHLDMGSRDVLLDCLKRYQGTILFVSHDRFFLRELSTQVLEIKKQSAYLYLSGYEEYLESSTK